MIRKGRRRTEATEKYALSLTSKVRRRQVPASKKKRSKKRKIQKKKKTLGNKVNWGTPPKRERRE